MISNKDNTELMLKNIFIAKKIVDIEPISENAEVKLRVDFYQLEEE